MSDLTHFDGDGKAVMVDVGAKPETERTASATVLMRPETLALTSVTVDFACDAERNAVDIVATCRLVAAAPASRWRL